MSEHSEVIRLCVLNCVDDKNRAADELTCNIKVEITGEDDFKEHQIQNAENYGDICMTDNGNYYKQENTSDLDMSEDVKSETVSEEELMEDMTVGLERESILNEPLTKLGRTEGKIRKLHICEVCGYSSNQKSHYTRHLQVHVKPFEFSCAICEIDVGTKKQLSSHMLTHRCLKDPSKFQCNRCNYKSNRLSNVTQHMQVHYKPKAVTYECAICDFKSKNEKKYNLHFAQHEKKLKCDICNLTFMFRSLLRKHMSDHKCPSDDTRYQCPECSYSGNKLHNLKVHMYVHRSDFEMEMLPCPHCPFKSKRKTDLEQHITVKHKREDEILMYECDHCQFRTKRRSHLTSHMTIRHQEICQVYICSYCNYSCISHFLYKIHISHHEENGFQGYPFLCSLCGKRYKRKVDLNKHIASSHNSKVVNTLGTNDVIDIKIEEESLENENTFRCQQCNFEDEEEDMVKLHTIIVHNGSVIDNCCTQCTFHTTSRQLYVEHLQIHEIDIEHLKPHLCEVCGSRWMRKGDLTKHMSVHWGSEGEKYQYERKPTVNSIKPIQCVFCSYSTKVRHYLYKHTAKVHGIERADGISDDN